MIILEDEHDRAHAFGFARNMPIDSINDLAAEFARYREYLIKGMFNAILDKLNPLVNEVETALSAIDSEKDFP